EPNRGARWRFDEIDRARSGDRDAACRFARRRTRVACECGGALRGHARCAATWRLGGIRPSLRGAGTRAWSATNPVTVSQPSLTRRRTAVIALGGNALAPAGESGTIYDQFRHTRQSLGPVVELALEGWNLCVVHGNGPQVGDELVRNEVARGEASPLPLGVLVAATAGWIGYMIQQSLENALRQAGSPRSVATIITQVQVNPTDPAMRAPTKFIGRGLSRERARQLRAEGQVVKTDGNGRLRRVVGSPAPLAIHELPVIKTLVENGVLVVACGGGGAPVYEHPSLGWEGVDAVIDKDLAAAVLARDLGAELLLIL